MPLATVEKSLVIGWLFVYNLDMNYELAKQLKDAGFPQGDKTGKMFCTYKGNNDHHCSEDFCLKPEITIPTLEELIEACGTQLDYIDNQWTKWVVYGDSTEDKTVDIKFEGKTPTEAVAKLWLELNG